MNRPNRHLTIDFAGSPGSGKTILAASFYYHLCASHGRKWFKAREEASPGIREQFDLIKEGKFPEPTCPTNGAALEDNRARREYLPLINDTLGAVDLIAQAGEELSVLLKSGNAQNIHDFAQRYSYGSNRLLGLVINPLLLNVKTARLWLRAMVAHLCGLYSSHDPGMQTPPQPKIGNAALLRSAIEVACWTLYELPAELEEGQDQHQRTVHTVHPRVKYAFTNLPEDARMICRKEEADSSRKFFIQSTHLTPRDAEKILQALDTIADFKVAEYRAGLNLYTPLLEDAEQVFVVLTRYDLVHLLGQYYPQHRCDEELLEHLNRRSHPLRVLKSDHLAVGFVESWTVAAEQVEDAVFIDTARMDGQTNALGDLVHVIETELRQGKATYESAVSQGLVRPQSGSAAKTVHYGKDSAAEAGWQVLRFSPLVFALAFLCARLISREWVWNTLGLCLLGSLGLLGIVWLGLWLSRRNEQPTWIISPAGEVTIRGIAAGQPVQSGEITVYHSALSSLADLGWVRWRDQKVRIPSVKRFLALTNLEQEDAPSAMIYDALHMTSLLGLFLAASFIFFRS